MYRYILTVTRNVDGEVLYQKDIGLNSAYKDLTEPQRLELESFIDDCILEYGKEIQLKYDDRTSSILGVNIQVEVKEEIKY